MKINILGLLTFIFLGASFCTGTKNSEINTPNSNGEWISLFDGESLDGWRVEENAESISVENGAIKIHGPRAHLYYVGEVENADFVNFEFKTQILTKENANSGVYFHTDYQDTGWPATGYEVQVNNTHGDWRKTGSLYNVIDVPEVYVEDDEWFELYFKVDGNEVIVKINDITVVHYTEPENPVRAEGERQDRILTSGTFAFQAHDPNSEMYYREIYVRPLP